MQKATGINVGFGAGSCPVLSCTKGATPALMGKSWVVMLNQFLINSRGFLAAYESSHPLYVEPPKVVTDQHVMRGDR